VCQDINKMKAMLEVEDVSSKGFFEHLRQILTEIAEEVQSVSF